MSNNTAPGFESSSRSATINGLKVHYHDAGSGAPLVLVHGSGPGATAWSNFSQNIVDLSQYFRVIALDCPGWGLSDTPSAENSDLVPVLEGLLDQLGLEKAALVGNSMGGAASISFATLHPERVSHLVTMGSPCPGPNLFSETMTTEGLKILFDTYREPSTENFMRLVSVMCFDPAFATEELARERAAATAANPAHVEKFLQPGNMLTLLPHFFHLGPKISEIAAPTLAIHGRNDRTVHYENSLQLVSLVPDARLYLFNQCGHWVQLEHAAEFNRVVRQFLEA